MVSSVPAGRSVSATTATAPAAKACGMKAVPSALLPGTATNTEPGATLRLSEASPDTVSPAKGPSRASGKRSPSAIPERAVMRSSGRNAPRASPRSPGAEAHHGGEGLDRRIEIRRNVQHGGHPFHDGAGDGRCIPARRGKAVRLGQALRLVDDGEEQIARLVGGSDGHEGGQELVLGIAASDHFLGGAGLAAHEI